jgi:hypothetical protein
MATRDVELADANSFNSEASDKVSLTANDKGPILDKLVVAVVIIGIIVFTAFQISESVAAHENPATKTTIEVVLRTYPGLMICPYSKNMAGGKSEQGVCPKWSPDALLQYDMPDIQFSFFNTNQHTASQRTRTRCPTNHVAALAPGDLSFGGEPLGNALLFGHFPSKLDRGTETMFYQKVIVKNSAEPKLSCFQNDRLECQNPQDAVTFPYLCPSFTPPNVQCIVFDPKYFDTQAKIYGMDPICNPMKEAVANTADSVSLVYQSFFYPEYSYDNRTGYKYSGLLPQPNLDKAKLFKALPTENFLSTFSLDSMKADGYDNPYFSIFAGVLAVLYNPAKGIPTTLNFDNAQDSTMSEDVLSSSVLFRTNCVGQSGSCPQQKFPPVRLSIANQVDREFSNKLSPLLVNKTIYSSNAQPATPEQTADLRIAFTSSSTVVTTQIISLSILTTISIIVSTAATLWGSQDKIKDGIALVKEKYDAYKKAK